MSERAIGIDLGTTNSVVAVVDGTGQPVVLPNRSGKRKTPSLVWFDGNREIVGDEAKEEMRMGGDSVASFFKRMMGDPEFRFVGSGLERTAVELSASVLRSLKEDAEQALGHAVADAVVTVPAFFHDPHRKATLRAGELAGLNILQLINEPTAAAIAYGVTNPPEGTRCVLVYDLGGGTFDVTLLEINPRETRVLTSEGDAELGGKDWDARVMDFLAAEFLNEFGMNPLDSADAVGDVWVAAESAKQALTDLQTTTVFIAYEGEKGRYSFSRGQFEELCQDLVDRTFDTIQTVLRSQALQHSEIDEVLLVGGSTRMPMIQEGLAGLFEKEPSHRVNVDEAVALGAAMCAHAHGVAKEPAGLASLPPGETVGKGLLLGLTRVTDVTPHSLGMIAVNENNTAYVNSIILPKDQSVPRRESRPYQHHTRPDSDNCLEVFMTQGERNGVDEVIYLGRYVIPNIPHDAGGTAIVDIDYSYDLSGSVQVAARLKSTGADLPVVVETLPQDVPDRFLKPPPVPVVPHVSVYLAFDLSGSMMGEPLAEAKKAATAFLKHVDLSHCSMGVIAVADQTTTVLKACQNASNIKNAIQSLTIGMVGFGNSAHPFDEAMRLLDCQKPPRFLIALADGVWCNQSQVIDKAKLLHEAEINVIAIGFGSADRAFLQAIASCDEGSFFTSLSGLTSTFSTIAQVITRTQGGLSLSSEPKQTTKRRFWGLLERTKG